MSRLTLWMNGVWTAYAVLQLTWYAWRGHILPSATVDIFLFIALFFILILVLVFVIRIGDRLFQRERRRR